MIRSYLGSAFLREKLLVCAGLTLTSIKLSRVSLAPAAAAR